MKIHLDFETRSTVDLRACGAYVYAEDPTTEIMCMVYAFNDEHPSLWLPGEKPPQRLLSAMYDALFYAHNAAFERLIWREICVKRLGWPAIRLDQWRCTMTHCYAMGLPGSLANAARACQLPMEKDEKGARVMKQLAKPRSFRADGSPTWWTEEEYPEKYAALYSYCLRDVEVERLLTRVLPPLSASEQRIWEMDQRINDRGVRVDEKNVRVALALIEAESKRLTKRIKELTGGAVSTPNAVGQIRDWLEFECAIETPSLDKADVGELLDRPDLPPRAREVLEVRKEAAKASTRKLKAMLNRVSRDGRIRGMFQYHGAHTGRWAGRGVQLHNLPRPSMKQYEIENVFDILDGVKL